MSQSEAKVVLSVVDRITGPLAGIQARINRLTAPIRNIGRAIGDIGRAAGVDRLAGRVTELGRRIGHTTQLARGLIAPLALAAGVGLTFGARDLIKTNAQFEKFGTVLETVLKSPEKAQKALGWISTFAAKTPYELAETTGAFVKLTSYGIDPVKGSLLSAGNAAAAMGKPLNQAVEAIADAMSGENERLKEFGITTSKAGGKIMYSWVENGKQMTASAKKNSREQILSVINGIWNRQYTGAMDKLSATWDGMVGNLKDQWARGMLAIGKAGFFDYIKGRLASLLDYVKGLADSGRLAEIGKQISDGLVGGVKAVEEALRAVNWGDVWESVKAGVEVVKSVGAALGWLSGLVGGPVQAALLVLGTFTLAPLLASIISVGAAFASVLLALLSPAGAVIVAIAALAGAAALVYRNWEPIKRLFSDIWAKLSEVPQFKAFENVNATFYAAGVAIVDSLWSGIQSVFSSRIGNGLRAELAILTNWMPEWLKGRLGLSEIGRSLPTGGASGSYAPPTPAIPGAPASGTPGVGAAQQGGASGGWTPSSPWAGATPPSNASANGRVAGAFAAPAAAPAPAPAPAVVPIVSAQPDINVSAPLNLDAAFNWSSADATLAQVRSLLERYRAESEARIRAATASALAD
ncbi:tape measure protein [Methylopila sp. M107]|uniref:tape measure protein n=1 Tax=Methylopila sp. M107 TaxID=1101190 RepID=UPI0003746577|nr:tape measure protein [Methylopila sp. M107]